MKLSIFKSVLNGQWYWHIKARNNRIVACGEGYKRRARLIRTLHNLFGKYAAEDIHEQIHEQKIARR